MKDYNLEKETELLGKALRKLREGRGLTQEEVLKATGISRSTMVEIEAGKRLARGINLLLLCIVYEVMPQQLMELAFKRWSYPVKPIEAFYRKHEYGASAKERAHVERRRKTGKE